MEYEESIKVDMDTLQIHVDRITHTSDHFDFMMDAAQKLIEQDLAYTDDTPSEQVLLVIYRLYFLQN